MSRKAMGKSGNCPILEKEGIGEGNSGYLYNAKDDAFLILDKKVIEICLTCTRPDCLYCLTVKERRE